MCTRGDASAIAPRLGPTPLQNGTVKSNEELVKVLNAAEVPGTDVVGEPSPAAAQAPQSDCVP